MLKYNKETESDKRGPRYFHLDVNINISMRSCAIFWPAAEHVVFPFPVPLNVHVLEQKPFKMDVVQLLEPQILLLTE